MDTVFPLRYYVRVLSNNPAKAKETEKFAAEMLRHVDHLYRVAFHMAKDRDRANECVQETYLRALNSRQQFEPGTNMKAWLTKILHNFFIDSYNKVKRMIAMDDLADTQADALAYGDGLAAPEPPPELRLLQGELSVQINDALQKIPAEFRAPVVLVDMGDFSYAEAAVILSCPVGTIRSRLSRGRRLLYKHLREYVGSNER